MGVGLGLRVRREGVLLLLLSFPVWREGLVQVRVIRKVRLRKR
jgi:hypothetical protein